MPQAAIAVAEWVGSAVLAAFGGPLAAGAVGTAIATAATVATLAAEVIAVSAATSALTPKVGGDFGTQVDWKADPRGPIPYAVGFTGTAGSIVLVRSAGLKSNYLNYATVYSGAGPIEGEQAFFANGQVVSFAADGGEGATLTTFYQNRMWLKFQLGVAGAPALQWSAANSNFTPFNHNGQPAEWTASHKLTGYAASFWGLLYDSAIYPQGTPRPLVTAKWVKVYDPRLDSTYPGGSGPCRALDESTYLWSRNGGLHALTWLLGRWQNGKRILGVGAPIATIDVAAFVEAANIADNNAWTCDGVVYSTDDKWEVLKAFLQTCGAKPIRQAARISCIVNTPRVSLDTLTGADVIGEATVTAGQGRRERINTIWPRYREQAQNFQIVAQDEPVTVEAYYEADGGQRSTEIEYSLVQNAPQAAQLARYDIEDAREIGPIALPCKPRWGGYRPGDCITVDEPDYGLNNQKCLILRRRRDPATMAVTLILRSETDGKHAFALGQTGVAPDTPALTGRDPTLVDSPGETVFRISGGVLTADDPTQALPAIFLVADLDAVFHDDPQAVSVIVDYRLEGDVSWTSWGEVPATTTAIDISGLAPASSYIVGLRYRMAFGTISNERTELGPVTTGGVAAATAGHADTATDADHATKSDKATLADTATTANRIGKYSASDFDPLFLALDDIGDITDAVDDLQDDAASARIGQLHLAYAMIDNAVDRVKALGFQQETAFFEGKLLGPVILEEKGVREEGQEQLAATIDLVGATNDDGTAFVFNLTTAEVLPGQSMGDTFDGISASIDGVSADVATESSARVSGDLAVASTVTALTSTVTTNNTTVLAAISSEAVTRASADSATSSTLTGLSSTVSSNLSTVTASITSEATTRATADSALSTTLTTLTSTVSGNLSTVNASISSEATTRATNDTAIAATVTTLTSTVSTNLSTVNASISSEAATRATNDTAIAATVTTLTSTVSGNTADITSEASTRASADSALSSTLTTLSSTVGGHTSTLSTYGATLADIDGSLSAVWGVQVDTDGNIAGVQLLTVSGGGTVTSLLKFRADRTEFWNGAGTTRLMALDGDGLFLNTNLARTDSLVADSVTRHASVNSSGQVNATTTNGDWSYCNSLSYTAAGGVIDIDATIYLENLQRTPDPFMVSARIVRTNTNDLSTEVVRSTNFAESFELSAANHYIPGALRPFSARDETAEAGTPYIYTLELSNDGYDGSSADWVTSHRFLRVQEFLR